MSGGSLARTDLRIQRDARNFERIERAQKALRMGLPPETITKLFDLSATDLGRLAGRL